MNISRWICSTPQKQWFEQPVKPAKAGPADLSLSGTRHQPWEGFGGCFNEIGWMCLKALGEDRRQEVLRSLFDPADGCRFNYCRLPIGASDYALEWYSHNEQDGDFAMEKFSIERDRAWLLPYIKSAMKYRPDMKLFASPWSPPTWMKQPKAYNYGTFIWKKEYLDAYALYFVKFVQAYKAEGITINQIHPQNEPTADQKFPSCLWSGAKLRDFIRDHMGPAFAAHKLSAEIWLGTINSDNYNEYAHTVLSDPAARKSVAGVGYQWGGKGAIQRTHESFPDLRLAQTENECGDGKNTWEYAQYIFELLRHYITNGARAYVYWNMILPPGGRSTWGWNQNAMINIDPDSKAITFNPEFYVMKHLSQFVEPGAVRVGLSGGWCGNAVAFANPDGKVVLAVMNPSAEARTISVEGQGMELLGRSFNTLVLQP